MPFETPITISDVISRIDNRRLLLPAIQREFVWGAEKVEWLFDSLLQGYPIGSFLFWEVRGQNDRNNFRYYEFLRDFRERYNTHNPEFNTDGHTDFNAVLDGQQRLTAIYIGLKGTYAYKRPRVWWEDNDRVLPKRKLYLNIQGDAPDDDEHPGQTFEFKFLTTKEYDSEPAKWFQVGKMLELVTAADLMGMFASNGYQNNKFSMNALSALHAAIHSQRLINYYTIQNADMDIALNVFVRVNSGGEPLSLPDMLMSTAIANWKTRDARQEIFGLIGQVHAKGFFISKDLVLKACLYLYSSDIRYKASNFSADQVKPFEEKWDAIQESILAVFDLVKDFGYNETSLTSKNALLPIIYWVHHKNLAGGLRSQVAMRGERDKIRRWLHTVLLKGIFGSSADTVLAAIRRAFAGDDFARSFVLPEVSQFPTETIGTVLRSLNKDPQVTDEFIDSLLSTQYEERSAFTILAILRPDLDYKNIFHKDHLHPASGFKRKAKLEAAGVSTADIDFYRDPRNWNSILNLSHLDANENKSKTDKPLLDWVTDEAERSGVPVAKFCSDRYLPTDKSHLRLERFRDFIGGRRTILGRRLRELLEA